MEPQLWHDSTVVVGASRRRRRRLFDCRAPATGPNSTRQGVSLSFSKDEKTNVWEFALDITDHTGKHQRYHTDEEAGLWQLREHHVTISVDGFARVIAAITNGIFNDGGSTRPQGWAHLGSYVDLTGAGDIEVVDGASECMIDARAVKLLRVYNRYLLTSEAIGNWRATTV